MTRICTQTIEFFGALWVLGSLAIKSRFRLKSPYWTWRLSTAFPNSKIPGGPAGMIRYSLQYARWAYRIRRLR